MPVLRPDADVTVGDWGVAPLFSKINEVTPDENGITNTGSGYSEVSLSDPAESLLGGNVIVRLQVKRNGFGDDNLVVALVVDGLVIASRTFVPGQITSSAAALSFTLSAAERAAVADGSAVSLRFSSTTTGGVEPYAGSTLGFAGSTTDFVGRSV